MTFWTCLQIWTKIRLNCRVELMLGNWKLWNRKVSTGWKWRNWKLRTTLGNFTGIIWRRTSKHWKSKGSCSKSLLYCRGELKNTKMKFIPTWTISWKKTWGNWATTEIWLRLKICLTRTSVQVVLPRIRRIRTTTQYDWSNKARLLFDCSIDDMIILIYLTSWLLDNVDDLQLFWCTLIFVICFSPRQS